MPQKRKRHSARFKFDVAMEAAKGQETVNRIAAKYEIHPSQVSQWKRQLLDEGTTCSARPMNEKRHEALHQTQMSKSAASRWTWSG